ncbi:MAG: class I adenylate-forming enzyme family protein [Solirubrobacteraceae bacterium]
MTAVGERNLGQLAQTSFERRGDYPSLLFEGRWYGSGELHDRARRLAGGLQELGVSPGERVVVTMANCPEVSIAYQALWLAGAVVTPAMFLLPVPELRHVIEDAQACGVITTPEFAPKVAEATAGLDGVRFVACTGAADGMLALADLEAAEPRPLVPRGDDDVAALMYTGGTTGRAKGVMLSHASLNYSGRSAHDVAYVAGIERVLTSLPLSHSYGLLVTIAGMHSSDRHVNVLMRWFEPSGFLAQIVEHRLQLTAVVPTMLQLLLAQPLHEHDLSSLRYVSCGGAPLAPEVADEFQRRVPSATIRQGYGLTESAALLCTNPTDAIRPGSVGLPVPGTEIEIRDDEGRALPVNEVGEICGRSPGLMQGYWRSPEATETALAGGWLHTGDVGRVDEDGYVYIVDRKKDLIIRGGFNVYPRDVEDALVEHPAIQMAAVVGRPSDRHGEEVVAFVALAPEAQADPSELVDWARDRIGGYKYPREIQVIDAIPLTPVGKIDRKALRARIASDAAAATGPASAAAPTASA